MADFRSAHKIFKIRIIFLSGFALIALHLFWMQVVDYQQYKQLSEKNRLRVIYLEGPRGYIFDRNGAVLAASRLSYNCSVLPYESRSSIHQSLALASNILNVDIRTLEKNYSKTKPGFFNSVILLEDIDPKKAMALEERLEMLPGFTIETTPRREYSYGPECAHLLGYLGPMTKSEEEDLTDWYGYRKSQWIGRDGLEKNYESFLRGKDGGFQVEVNSRGRLVRYLGVKEPSRGQDIKLTIDAKLQKHVQQILEGQKGAAVVMDLKDGSILSMNSSPTYDPNQFVNLEGRKEVAKYLKGSDAPMLNRAIRGQYPPGSIFKIVTAAVGLSTGKISAVTKFACPGFLMIGGKRFNCWKEDGHGPQLLEQAFAHSCNVYFYRVGLLAGFDALLEKTLAFGFGRLTGIDLPGERPGFVPTREWKRKFKKEGWYEGETANLAIGQGYLQVTPVQALVMVSAIATHGKLFRPHLVDSIGGQLLPNKNFETLKISESQLSAISQGLKDVVDSDTGTGRLVRVPGLRVAGKTGTAQSGQAKTHAWIVAYAPQESPKVAVAVFLENGGRGGVAAAKTAQPILSWLKQQGYV